MTVDLHPQQCCGDLQAIFVRRNACNTRNANGTTNHAAVKAQLTDESMSVDINDTVNDKAMHAACKASANGASMCVLEFLEQTMSNMLWFALTLMKVENL